MMERFGFIFVFLFIIFNDSQACFKENTKTTRMFPTGSSIFEECCCTETDDGGNVKKLEWYDPITRTIGKLGSGWDSSVYVEEQGNCLSLHIPKSDSRMSGSYTCLTRYKGETVMEVHVLDIYDPLTFQDTKPSQTIYEGIDCVVGCWSKGASKPHNRWYRMINDEPVEIIFSNSTKYIYYDGDLLVKNVDANDKGVYRCEASVYSTGEEIEMDIDVKVNMKPVIKQLSAATTTVIAGETLSITCDAEAEPIARYEWKKIPELKSEGHERWNQTNGTITINSVEPKDAGVYQCTAINEVGNAQKQINIVVYYAPEIIEFNNITAVEGSERPFFCNVTGYPLPNVTISYEGKSLDTTETGPAFESLIPNYSIFKVERSKTGFYVCNASNEVDFTTEIMYLTVEHKPYFEKVTEDVWGWNGAEVTLSCEHESNPPSNVTWIYRSNNSTSVIRVATDKNNPLILKYLINDQFTAYGEYICKAMNSLGNSIKTVNLRRGYPPSYVEYVSTVESTATSFLFSIDPPIDFEGPTVIGFITEYDEKENYNITDVHPNRTWGIERPFKLDNLKSNTSYLVRFAAINSVGTGPWSDLMELVTLDKSAPESPIFESDPLQIGSNKILKWKTPQDNGAPIDFYVLRYCPANEQDTTQCKEHNLKSVSEVQLNDLQFNTTYNFELVAHNAEGNSTSATLTATLPETGEPEPILSGAAIIGISIAVVLICLILLDVLFYCWKRQGIIASCCCKNRKKKIINPRDGKDLLKDNGESASEGLLRRPNNGHKEYEYNKTTGAITGKNSDV